MSATAANPAEFQDAGKPVAPPAYLVDGSGNPLASTSSEVNLPVQQSSANAAVAAGAGTTVVKGAPGTLCTVVITAAGTASLQIFDNASAGSGTLLLITPATTTLGQIFNIFGAATKGITALGATGTPAATVFYS